MKRLSVFGSFLREDLGPDSDIDVLIEFLPGARVSLLDMVGMELGADGIAGAQSGSPHPAGT